MTYTAVDITEKDETPKRYEFFRHEVHKNVAGDSSTDIKIPKGKFNRETLVAHRDNLQQKISIMDEKIAAIDALDVVEE